MRSSGRWAAPAKTGTRHRGGVAQGEVMTVGPHSRKRASHLLLAAGLLAVGTLPLAGQDESSAANDAAASPPQAVGTGTQTTAGPEAAKSGPRMEIYGFAMLDM